MVDVDGVAVMGRPTDGAPWKTDLLQDLGVAPERLAERFFNPHWQEIVTGQKPIIPFLKEALAGMGAPVTAADVMRYWFSQDARLNMPLLTELQKVREIGAIVYFATNQEPARATYLWQNLGLSHFADGMFSSADLGFAKPEQMFFDEVVRRTQAPACAHLLLDDTRANITAACDAGWCGHHWVAGDDLAAVLNEWGVGV